MVVHSQYIANLRTDSYKAMSRMVAENSIWELCDQLPQGTRVGEFAQ
jgi:hypothetical protein